MKRGEVWWVNFDPSRGSEIRKTRPAVIISNDTANKYLSRVVVIPITSNTDNVYPSEAVVTVDGKLGKVLCDQVMTADKSRLSAQIDVLEDEGMSAVENALKVHLGLPL